MIFPGKRRAGSGGAGKNESQVGWSAGLSSSAVRAATAAEEKGSGNGKADMLELSSGDHFGERELFFRHQEETNAVRERTPASITTTTLALVAVVGPSSRISLPTGPLVSIFPPVCFGFVVSLTRSLIYMHPCTRTGRWRSLSSVATDNT